MTEEDDDYDYEGEESYVTNTKIMMSLVLVSAIINMVKHLEIRKLWSVTLDLNRKDQ